MSQYLNIPVDDFSSPIDLFVEKETTVIEAYLKMNQSEYRHVPILENGKALGMLSQRDLTMMKLLKGDEKLTVEDLIFEEPLCVKTGSSIESVAFKMSEKKFGSALIVDASDTVIGIFTSIDALNALIEVVRGDVD